jgi:hypothetical protein
MYKACFDDGVNQFVVECSYFDKKDKPEGSTLLSVEEVKQQYESNTKYIGLAI